MNAARRFPKQEFARRGEEVYESQVRPTLSVSDEGKFAAIDIETSSFEIDDDELRACDRLTSRVPGAQVWLVKIGSRHLHRFGGHTRRESS